MCLKWSLEYIDCLLFLTWFYIWRAACSPIAARLRWYLWLQWDCINCLCGVGDVTNLACGCSSWLNYVVYHPWVAWLFQYLAAGFSKTRDFITKLSGTADYYYLRAPPLCSVPGGWRRRKPLEWRNVIALVMMAYLLHGTSSYCVNYALLLLHGTLRDCPAMEKAFFSASGLIRQE